MAYDPLNLGAEPNDKTGTNLREAGGKLNDMLLELYTDLATKADATATTEALALLLATDADTAAALATKADAAALANYAPLSTVPKFTGAQTITNAQRLQLAVNTGLLVSLPMEVLSPVIELDGEFLFELPRLPKNFLCSSMSLTATLITGDVTLVDLLAELNHSNSPVLGQANNLPFSAGGVCEMTITAPNSQLNLGTPLKLTVTATRTAGTATGRAYGLTLWLLGAWTA